MKRAIAIFLILASLIAFVSAADVPVQVSNTANALTFTPQTVMANMGDNIVFTWAGTLNHSIIQSDAAKSCVKSASATPFSSGGSFVAPKTWSLPATTAGKMWFYCGVGNHCASGMYGTLIVAGGSGTGTGTGTGGNDTTTPSATASGSASMGSMMPTPTASGSPSSGAKSSAARSYAAGFLASSMCLVAAFML